MHIKLLEGRGKGQEKVRENCCWLSINADVQKSRGSQLCSTEWGYAETLPEAPSNVSLAVCPFTYLLVLEENNGSSSYLCFPNHVNLSLQKLNWNSALKGVWKM